jgi:hypothetical protein
MQAEHDDSSTPHIMAHLNVTLTTAPATLLPALVATVSLHASA